MTTEILLDSSPENLELADDKIHVFCASLDVSVGRLERLSETLSEDERARASRFIFERDRNRFAAGRGMLREILGWFLQVEPGELAFSYGFRGKPRLAMAWGNFLHFNLAHSDSLAVYAVSREHEIGVDVERIRPVREAEQITDFFFTKSERAQMSLIPPELKVKTFFQYWTGKEAFLKAHGEGIDTPLNQVEVLFESGRPMRASCLADGSCRVANLQLQSFVPALGYTGTVATRDGSVKNCWIENP